MRISLKKSLLGLAALFTAVCSVPVYAAQTQDTQKIQVEIVSPERIESMPIYEGPVEIKVTNNGTTDVSGLNCYLSVIDLERKQSFPMDEFGGESYQTRALDPLAPAESTTITIPLRVMYVGNFQLTANVVDTSANVSYASNVLEMAMTSASTLNKPLVLTVSVLVPAALLAVTWGLMKKRGRRVK